MSDEVRLQYDPRTDHWFAGDDFSEEALNELQWVSPIPNAAILNVIKDILKGGAPIHIRQLKEGEDAQG